MRTFARAFKDLRLRNSIISLLLLCFIFIIFVLNNIIKKIERPDNKNTF